jgi:undecaprenyl-diphosphatase
MSHLTYAQAVVTGLVQGVTELFPISSLGHNVLLPALIGGQWAKDLSVSAPNSPYLAFIVGLHVATALAMILYFWRDWLRIIRGFLSSLRHRQIATPDQRLAWMIVLATIPVGIAGAALQKVFTTVFAKPTLTAVFLAINGAILLYSERQRRVRQEREAAAGRDEWTERGYEPEYAEQPASWDYQRRPQRPYPQRPYPRQQQPWQQHQQGPGYPPQGPGYPQDPDHSRGQGYPRGGNYPQQGGYSQDPRQGQGYPQQPGNPRGRHGYPQGGDYPQGGYQRKPEFTPAPAAAAAPRREETDDAVAADRRLSRIGYGRAVIVGSAQILALLPGISRDGIVTVAGMGRGLSRQDAVRFSFLLSAPVILAAGVLKVHDLFGPLGKGIHGPVLVGSLLAGIGAFVSVRFLTRYFSESRSLRPFGIYCIAAGVLSFAYLLVR